MSDAPPLIISQIFEARLKLWRLWRSWVQVLSQGWVPMLSKMLGLQRHLLCGIIYALLRSSKLRSHRRLMLLLGVAVAMATSFYHTKDDDL